MVFPAGGAQLRGGQGRIYVEGLVKPRPNGQTYKEPGTQISRGREMWWERDCFLGPSRRSVG